MAPCPCALTGADPLPVPQTPHLKQTPLCPRLSCWDGHGLQRQQIQSPGEGPSGHRQKGGQAELTPQTLSPPMVGPPQATHLAQRHCVLLPDHHLLHGGHPPAQAGESDSGSQMAGGL